MYFSVIHLLSFTIPAFVQLLYSKRFITFKKYSWFSAIIVSIFANCAAFVMGQFMPVNSFTEYEYLYVVSVVSVLCITLLCPVLNRAAVNHVHVLKTACILCLCTAAYSILTYGQAHIHGDVATASLLTQAQLDHRSFFPNSWCYVNGDIWILTIQTFVAPFSVFLKNQSLARMLGSALLVLVATFVTVFHSKKAFCDDSWVISIPILLLFLRGHLDLVLYQAAYTNQILILLISFYTFYELQRTSKKRFYILFCGFIAVLVMSGIRYLAELVLPIWLTCIIMDYLAVRKQLQYPWKTIFKKWLRVSLCIFIPVVIGYLAQRWICSRGIVINTDQNSLYLAGSVWECMDNILTYVVNLFSCFGFQGSVSLLSLNGIQSIASILMCLLVIFVVPFLQALRIHKEDIYTQYFFTFTMIHNLIMFVLTTFFVGKTLSHYLLTSIFLTVFLSSRYIYKYWISQIPFDKYLWTGMFIVAIIIGSLSLITASAGWQNHLIANRAVTRALLDRELTKGYGNFWYAYAYEVYSDFELSFGAIEIENDKFYPHQWLVDNTVFHPEDTQTFLLVSEEEMTRMSPIIEKQFSKPDDYFTVANYHVFVFGYDIASDLI